MDIKSRPSSTTNQIPAIPPWMISTFVAAAQDVGASCHRSQLSQLATELTQRWASSHRFFHNCAFLRSAIARIDEFSPVSHNPSALHLAVWFYGVSLACPLNPEDEDAVATATQHCCDTIENCLPPLGVPQEQCSHICNLVRAAITIKADPHDLDTAVLVDALLSQFAATPQEYKLRRIALRQELASLTESQYLQYRQSFLRGLLQRPQIFRSPLATIWETQARHNIEGELAGIDAQLVALGSQEATPVTWGADLLGANVPIPSPVAVSPLTGSHHLRAAEEQELGQAGARARDALNYLPSEESAGSSAVAPTSMPVPDSSAADDAKRLPAEGTPEMSSLEMTPDLLAPVKKGAPKRLSAKEQARAMRSAKSTSGDAEAD